MNTETIFRPVKVFCSYSHTDAPLKIELDKHLATLKKLGQIELWHDRQIGAGERWQALIDKNLRTSEIILLLVSPDFISSNYCYDVECQLALELEKTGKATVIPILMRPVDLKGLPLSALQYLPTNGIPVDSWPNSDEALKNVAEGIREAVTARVRHSARTLASQGFTGQVREPRLLDAAISNEIPIGKFREVLAMITPAESGGLRLTLSDDQASVQPKYSCGPSDVSSEPFFARYSQMANGDLKSLDYRIAIVAPDLEIADEPKVFTLQPREQSIVFKFFIKADLEGEYRLRVDLFEGGHRSAEGLLSTIATLHGPDGGPGRAAGYLLASVQLVFKAVARAAVLYAGR